MALVCRSHILQSLGRNSVNRWPHVAGGPFKRAAQVGREKVSTTLLIPGWTCWIFWAILVCTLNLLPWLTPQFLSYQLYFFSLSGSAHILPHSVPPHLFQFRSFLPSTLVLPNRHGFSHHLHALLSLAFFVFYFIVLRTFSEFTLLTFLSVQYSSVICQHNVVQQISSPYSSCITGTLY